ncbi:hypothetical protein ACFLW0_06180 [Chloroflexota bacterium]
MYRQPYMDEKYKEEWLKAERELALRWSEASSHPDVNEAATPDISDKDGISRNDFLKALKRVSRKVDKAKVAPKQS